MEQITITYLGERGYIATTPTSIAVIDYSSDPSQSLQRILMAHPGVPVTFLISGPGRNIFPSDIFSMAETRLRTFIVATTVARTAIDPEMPVSWIEPDNIMPGVPGDISVAATANNTANVTFTITGTDGSTISYHGDTGRLSVNANAIMLDRPGQTINI